MSFNTKLSALLIAGSMMVSGCVEVDRVEEIEKESLDEIAEKIADFCRKSATDVNSITCALSDNGRDVADLTLGCWSNRGEWTSSSEDLDPEYDRLVIEDDCVTEGSW